MPLEVDPWPPNTRIHMCIHTYTHVHTHTRDLVLLPHQVLLQCLYFTFKSSSLLTGFHCVAHWPRTCDLSWTFPLSAGMCHGTCTFCLLCFGDSWRWRWEPEALLLLLCHWEVTQLPGLWVPELLAAVSGLCIPSLLCINEQLFSGARPCPSKT